jgi:L-fucose isomerase-like protein
VGVVDRKITFGLIVGTRGFFTSSLATEGRRQLVRKLGELDYGCVILPEDATPTAAVETRGDAKKCGRLFYEHRDDIDGIIVALPNFGDELGVVESIRMAGLDVPVLVQASDDEVGKLDLVSRRDSFCGKLSICNNLYQYNIPFTDTTLHTCAIESDVFTEDVHRFARVCRVVRGLRAARVGAIGTRPAAFQTMRSSEKLLQSSGITVVPVDLSEILSAARRLDDGAAEVKDKLAGIRDYGRIASDVAEENVLKQAKFSVAVGNWIAENEIDAAGVQCWTSILLGERMIPCACEVDVTGVVSMYALDLATGKPAAILDWNNNYGEDRDKCINTHCSNYPKSFIANDIEISALGLLGRTLGPENCFGAVNGYVAPGPMTFFRVSTDDALGCVKTYLGEGVFTDDPVEMGGGIAICRVDGLQRLMKYVCANGFEHHVAMARSHVADVLDEACGKYMGWGVYRHGAS